MLASGGTGAQWIKPTADPSSPFHATRCHFIHPPTGNCLGIWIPCPGIDLKTCPALPLLICLLIPLVGLTGGCSVQRASIHRAHQAFYDGDFSRAKSQLQAIGDRSRPDRHSTALDLAMVELTSGNAAAAEKRLRELRDHFDQHSLPAPIDNTLSLTTDDLARAYRINDYETVLLRSMLAICSLANDGVDAPAYCLQATRAQDTLWPVDEDIQAEINQASASMNLTDQEDVPESGDLVDDQEPRPDQELAEQQQVEQEAAERALQAWRSGPKVALPAYLRGTMREATHMDYSDAAQAFRLVNYIQPSFIAANHDIARAEQGVHSKRGHGVLCVIALVGPGPRLVETQAPTTTASLQIASMILQSSQGDVQIPNLASVRVPTVEIPHSDVMCIGVSALSPATRSTSPVQLVNHANQEQAVTHQLATHEQILGVTETLTDVGALAFAKSEAEMPWTVARAVARRVTKEAAVHTTTKMMGLDGTQANLAHAMLSTAWSASERTDTRCWGLLPREFQALRPELPVGQNVVELAPVDQAGNVIGDPVQQTVTIRDGETQFLIVTAPQQILSVVSTSDDRSGP